ncbi:hypothetical protein ACS0TY_013223 [Phlomoides rotata]
MAAFNCFCPSLKKKKHKGGKEKKNSKSLRVNLQTSSETTELRSTSFDVSVPFRIPPTSRCNVKVMNRDSPIAAEMDYEGGDERDETFPISKDEECFQNSNEQLKTTSSSPPKNKIGDDVRNTNSAVMFEIDTSGHVSDPGTGKAEFWASPILKRSCSNLSMRSMSRELDEAAMPLSKCKSYEEMQRLTEMYTTDVLAGGSASPVSHISADKVMLKKHSSSQILPSRSRKLWWKLFLWSHRNLHTAKPLPTELGPSAINQHGGYSSDTVEPKQAMDSRNLTSPRELLIDKVGQSWNGFYGVSGMWPQNQWVAFPTSSSPLGRVDEWVKDVSSQPPYEVNNGDHYMEDDGIFFPSSPERGSSPLTRHQSQNYLDEISHANTVIQSLNTNSNVAHITGLGLKAIPSVQHFASLRSVNLSGNLIGHITPGSLPKGLHLLNLSRNKISSIEGLRELTRLRVLDLSYNRISRIGQGLSNCTLIKELYLAGNKISMVEGLHRLLKLTVLDLSFNKITTAKGLGQLVANYNSLIAINLLGNPIQSNISDDLLRKTLCSLLPKLALLSKQPINTQKARELRVDANAKAALGSSSWNSRRKAVKRGGTSQKSKHRPKNRSHHY